MDIDDALRMQEAEEDAPLREGFYYTGDMYLAEVPDGIIKIKLGSLKHRLKRKGCSSDRMLDAVVDIEDNNHVAYAGALAGRKIGLHRSECGAKLLATNSPEIIQGEKGKFPTISKFLRDLLGGEPRQVERFMVWLQSAREIVVEGQHKPGHILGLAGEKGCGKSQLIDLIRLVMGGRTANPRDYFCGGRFNADLLSGELLVMDDEDFPSTEKARSSLKQRIKNLIYGKTPRIEAKGKDAFTFRGCWRVVVACNLSEDDLRALPAVDDSTEDKLLYMVCGKAFPEVILDDEFEKWQEDALAELPQFIHAVERFEVPQDLLAGRGKIKGWQHPEILQRMSSLDGWRALLESVDAMYDKNEISLPWTGRARELEGLLTAPESSERRNAMKLFGNWHGKAGALLTDACKHSDRVEPVGKLDGVQQYRVRASLQGEGDSAEEIPF